MTLIIDKLETPPTTTVYSNYKVECASTRLSGEAILLICLVVNWPIQLPLTTHVSWTENTHNVYSVVSLSVKYKRNI